MAEQSGTGIDRDAYFTRWSELHGGMDPRSNRLVAFWLTLVHAMAKPLVRLGASPDTVTFIGMGLAVGVVGAAWLGWTAAAMVLVFVSGIVDNLDGAVAVMSGRTARWGYVLDSVADRVADLLYLVALFLLGAPAWVCVAAGALTFLQEYTRARAAAGGMSEVGVVSVWERPSRVLVTGMFLLAATLHSPWTATLMTIAAAVSLVLGAIGLMQVVTTVHRRLTGRSQTTGQRRDGDDQASPPESSGS